MLRRKENYTQAIVPYILFLDLNPQGRNLVTVTLQRAICARSADIDSRNTSKNKQTTKRIDREMQQWLLCARILVNALS